MQNHRFVGDDLTGIWQAAKTLITSLKLGHFQHLCMLSKADELAQCETCKFHFPSRAAGVGSDEHRSSLGRLILLKGT